MLALGANEGGVLALTLGITRIVEQESLDLSIWGSTDGVEWGTQPLIAFSQKFYCGTYELVLDLSERPDVKYLRAQWQVNRWGRGEATPLFDFYVFAKQLQPVAVAIGA